MAADCIPRLSPPAADPLRGRRAAGRRGVPGAWWTRARMALRRPFLLLWQSMLGTPVPSDGYLLCEWCHVDFRSVCESQRCRQPLRRAQHWRAFCGLSLKGNCRERDRCADRVQFVQVDFPTQIRIVQTRVEDHGDNSRGRAATALLRGAAPPSSRLDRSAGRPLRRCPPLTEARVDYAAKRVLLEHVYPELTGAYRATPWCLSSTPMPANVHAI